MKAPRWLWVTPLALVAATTLAAAAVSSFKAGSAYDASEDMKSRVKAVEVEQVGLKDDVKEIREDIKELLRRTPKR